MWRVWSSVVVVSDAAMRVVWGRVEERVVHDMGWGVESPS